MDGAPKYITCDLLSRLFPPEWKDIYFRRFSKPGDHSIQTYECPLCGRPFTHEDIDQLHGHHIWPYSLFGETAWDNYQLICGSCNTAKGNRIEKDLRSMLGSGEFRSMVGSFLKIKVEEGAIDEDPIIRQLIEATEAANYSEVLPDVIVARTLFGDNYT